MNETQRGRRADLEALQLPGTELYLADRIFPVLPVKVKSGKMNYRELLTKQSAGAVGSAGTVPTTTYFAATSLDWSVAGKTKRFGIPYHEVENFGGIEAADKAGGEGAKLALIDDIEKAAVSTLFGGTAHAVSAGNFIDAVKAGKKALKRYRGAVTLVLSQTAYDTVMEYEDVQDRLALFNSVQPSDNEQILSLNRKLLAMAVEVDEVLIGDDEFWGATVSGTDYSAYAALVKIAPEDINAHTRQAVYAKQITYYPGDESRFEVKSFPDDNEQANKYDGMAWYKFQVFNSGASYVLNGISEANADSSAGITATTSTATTSTTTTTNA